MIRQSLKGEKRYYSQSSERYYSQSRLSPDREREVLHNYSGDEEAVRLMTMWGFMSPEVALWLRARYVRLGIIDKLLAVAAGGTLLELVSP